jgi:MFS family permease
MGTCEIAAVFFAIPLIGYWGRRSTLIFTVFMALATVVSAVAFHEGSDGCDSCHHLETLSLGLLKFALTGNFVAMTILITEMFPTVIRDIAFGGASFCARVSSCTSPAVIAMCDYIGMNPLITIIPPLLFACILNWWLPETLHKDMPDYIPEERE